MNSHIKLFFNIFCILSIIACSTVEEVKIDQQNILKEIELKDSDYQIILAIESAKDQYMTVEYIFSHPSKFDYTFNKYDIDDNKTKLYSNKDAESNENIFYFDENVQVFPLNQKRMLSSDFSENQTDIISDKESIYGKNKVYLKLNDQIENIVFSIFPKEQLKGTEKLYIKYKITENKEAKKYTLNNAKIGLTQDKDMLNITFEGIKYDDSINFTNIIVNYQIKLFDKNSLESMFEENIYLYAFDTQAKALFSTNLILKGKVTQDKNYLVIKAPLNENKEQLLLINVKITNKDLSDEELLQYEVYNNIIVKEQSKERVWPDEDKKKKDDDEIDAKKNREENRPILILILGLFIGSVVITFIGVFIYIQYFAKKDGNIEEDQDYKDVGGIVTAGEDKDKEKQETKEDGPKINEEEE